MIDAHYGKPDLRSAHKTHISCYVAIEAHRRNFNVSVPKSYHAQCALRSHYANGDRRSANHTSEPHLRTARATGLDSTNKCH
jgi:hypothetical protein